MLISNDQYQMSGHMWLVYLPEVPIMNVLSISDLFKSIPLRLDSQVFAFCEEGKGKRLSVYGVFFRLNRYSLKLS